MVLGAPRSISRVRERTMSFSSTEKRRRAVERREIRRTEEKSRERER